MKNKIDGLKIDNICASYKKDTNTIVFYNELTQQDEDTIFYRNQTKKEIAEAIKDIIKNKNWKVKRWKKWRKYFY